jgi:hypothetical protein|tara:strand:+ start:17 stop:283 length:267 start_codon:yes stop_codon:yes gene_type:complete
MKTLKEFKLDDKLDKYVADEIRKRKIAKHVINATDDIRMRMAPNKPAFKFPTPTGNMMIHVFIRPAGGLPKGMKKGEIVAYNYQLEEK